MPHSTHVAPVGGGGRLTLEGSGETEATILAKTSQTARRGGPTGFGERERERRPGGEDSEDMFKEFMDRCDTERMRGLTKED